ncbi:MAG TPA: ABC transporter permease [Candidatus Methylomirabilis sp.]|nr:ABC transporter permease [Candidatus Methylomirabilis sp.]
MIGSINAGRRRASMTYWARFSSWLRSTLRRPRMENEMDSELRFHVEARVEDLARQGLPREEAMRRARMEFGGVERAKEECREARGLGMFDGLSQDLRYGLRMLRKNLGLTLVAVLTTALGIAANVTVFSVVDALFLRSVPAKNPERLVRILALEKHGEGLSSVPEFTYLRAHTKTVEDLTAHYSLAPLYVSADGEVGEVTGAVVSSSYFSLLGLQPYLGRFFSSDEDSVPDRDAVAVLGYGFWQRTYNADPGILGKTLLINRRTFTIIGVMQPGFHGTEIGGTPDEIWIPTMMIHFGYRHCDVFQPPCTILAMMGRLRPGVRVFEAQAEIATLMAELRASGLSFDQRLGASVTPAIGVSENREYSLLMVRLLATIAGVLLLIVCANLGGLLVARGTARGGEIAMRLALGAGRGRIVRQLLTESLLLALAGGALGFLLSTWTSQVLVNFYSVDDEGYKHLFDVRPDVTVFLFSLAATAAAGVLFGLLPALQASRTDLNDALKGSGRTANTGRNLSRTALAGIQVAFSLALLVGAGLLARSNAFIQSGSNMDLHHVLGLRLPVSFVHYPPDKAYQFKREVVRRLRELPGVESVSLAVGRGLVWRAGDDDTATLPGKNYAKPDDEPRIGLKPVAPDYFNTLKIPFVSGRDFNDSDKPGSPPVTIVNETFARQIAEDQMPLGWTVLLDDEPYQIVGLVKDAQMRSIAEGHIPVAYTPFWQDPTLLEARMAIRVAGDPAAALPMVRKAIASIDPEVPVTEAMPLMDQVRGAYMDTRVASAVLSCAALLALILSAIGLYGVISYEVGRRTKEIGLRMALGAGARDVVQLFLRQGFGVVVIGIACGGVLAFATTRLLGAWLFGVGASDPLSFGAAAAVLLAVTLSAAYLPTRRATQVDPMVALREQ